MSVLKDKVNRLLSDLRKGKHGAFEELYDATYNHLKVVACNYVFDTADVDEVLNTAYFRIYRYACAARSDRDGYNWLCKIVQHAAYDCNKRRQITVPVNKIESHLLFEELCENAEERGDLFEVIRTFPESDQKLIYLKFWEDLSYAEIGTFVGEKKSTVYKQIKKILHILEEKLRTK